MNPSNFGVLRKLLRPLSEAEIAALVRAKLLIAWASSSRSPTLA
jgi:hypothetical protein